jgi:hypothetical protein
MYPDYYLPERMTVWSVTWGGRTYIGDSAYDVMKQVLDGSQSPLDQVDQKWGISNRVFMQYRVRIDPSLPDALFLVALAEAGILELHVSGDTPPDVFQEAIDFYTAIKGK